MSSVDASTFAKIGTILGMPSRCLLAWRTASQMGRLGTSPLVFFWGMPFPQISTAKPQNLVIFRGNRGSLPNMIFRIALSIGEIRLPSNRLVVYYQTLLCIVALQSANAQQAACSCFHGEF
jgi:hypothetical protein